MVYISAQKYFDILTKIVIDLIKLTLNILMIMYFSTYFRNNKNNINLR